MVEARGVEAKSEPHYSDGADAGERSARFSGTKATVPGNGFSVAGPEGRAPVAPLQRASSSVGESARLISVRSAVRLCPGPLVIMRGCSSAGRARALQA